MLNTDTPATPEPDHPVQVEPTALPMENPVDSVRICWCGCRTVLPSNAGRNTRFIVGHDAKLASLIVSAVVSGKPMMPYKSSEATPAEIIAELRWTDKLSQRIDKAQNRMEVEARRAKDPTRKAVQRKRITKKSPLAEYSPTDRIQFMKRAKRILEGKGLHKNVMVTVENTMAIINNAGVEAPGEFMRAVRREVGEPTDPPAPSSQGNPEAGVVG
jgi:hypothetical protein